MKNPTAYLKMRVMGAVDYAQGTSTKKRIQEVSQMTFTDEEGFPRQFTWRTISTWLYRYKSQGITGVQNKKRSDKGTTRKITPEELSEALEQVKPYFREKNYNKFDLYRKCIEKGHIRKEQVSQTSFYRLVREYDLLKPIEETKDKRRLAFAMQYANQMWQGDTMFGPFMKDPNGKNIQVRLIAFIDDASRVLCHGEFFFNENTDTLVTTLKSAFYKRGIPETIYVDNGSIYTSKEITLICARLGTMLRHAPVRDGAAKGKIERFFRGVRERFLLQNLDLSSLKSLNKQFTKWVEEDYNSHKHSTIGMKPIDRFAMDIKRIRFLPPGEVNDELFYAEDERKVKKDNTFSFKGNRYECPAHLRDKTITVRYNRLNTQRIIIFFKGERMGEAKELNLIANGQIRRTGGQR